MQPARIPVDVRVLDQDELHVLSNVAPNVFDHDVDPRWAREFFADQRHHLAVAVDGGRVVGMASGVHYVHPDKAPQLFVNEVGVAPTHRGQGIAKRLLAALFERGRSLGCTEAWVLTSRGNEGAMRLYAAAGGEAEETVMFTFHFAPGSPRRD